jgi:ABC-2 type transport system permease protein
MRNTVAIAGKELRSYFASPIAYVVITVFLVVTGLFFYYGLHDFPYEATVRHYLAPFYFQLLVVMLASVLTMRLIAEEQKTGTIELLLTAPVRDLEVVMGKFLSALAILVVMLAITLYYPLLMYWFGSPDSGPIFSAYLGALLMGAAFVALGVFSSTLSANQIVAAVVSIGVLSLLLLFDWIGEEVGGDAGGVLGYLAFPNHYEDFYRGIIDTEHLIYFLSFIAVSLFLATRSLETRRWR